MKKALIIGGGFAGCAAAHQLSMIGGWRVELVETAPFLGGGCKTFTHGGHPYTFGPRHFLTKDEKLFGFLNQYIPMRQIPEHEFLTYVERDERFYHFPIHRDEVSEMPDAEHIEAELEACPDEVSPENLEEFWVQSVGPTLYDKFVNSYSKKMWQIESNTELTEFGYTAKGVALKSGPNKACWNEAISAFPVAQNGYDDYFDVSTAETTVHLSTRIEKVDVDKSRALIDGEWHDYDILINTVSPEFILNGAFGPLRWMGRDFFKIVLPVPEVFPENVYFLYYANQEPFTRIVEYKKFYRYESPMTLIGLEIPSNRNKLYPFTTKKDYAKAKLYHDALPENVFSIGRAASYRYLDVAPIIQQSMDMRAELEAGRVRPAA